MRSTRVAVLVTAVIAGAIAGAISGVMALLMVVASPAAASNELLVSRDGRTWTEQFEAPLFDPQVAWVPGKVRTSQFFVRNVAADVSTLRISVASQDTKRLLDTGEIVIETRTGTHRWAPLQASSDNSTFECELLAEGASERVQVRAVYRPGAADRARREQIDLRFDITLVEATVRTETGTQPMAWYVVLGGGLIGTGLALVRRGRHNRKDDRHAAA